MTDFACPQCGALDWKKKKEEVVREYKECKNCGHAPFRTTTQFATDKDLATWIEETKAASAIHLEAFEAAFAAEAAGSGIGMAKAVAAATTRKASRLYEDDLRKLRIFNAVAEIIAEAEQGSVTVMLPEQKVGVQFIWGEPDMLKQIKSMLSAD